MLLAHIMLNFQRLRSAAPAPPPRFLFDMQPSCRRLYSVASAIFFPHLRSFWLVGWGHRESSSPLDEARCTRRRSLLASCALSSASAAHPPRLPPPTATRTHRTKGVGRTGCRNDKTHTTCRRCGKVTYHIQKAQCGSCGYGRQIKMRRCTSTRPPSRRCRRRAAVVAAAAARGRDLRPPAATSPPRLPRTPQARARPCSRPPPLLATPMVRSTLRLGIHRQPHGQGPAPPHRGHRPHAQAQGAAAQGQERLP